MDCDLGEGWSAFFLLKKSKDGVSSGKSQPQRGPGCADSGGFYLLVCMEFTRFSTPLDHRRWFSVTCVKNRGFHHMLNAESQKFRRPSDSLNRTRRRPLEMIQQSSVCAEFVLIQALDHKNSANAGCDSPFCHTDVTNPTSG